MTGVSVTQTVAQAQVSVTEQQVVVTAPAVAPVVTVQVPGPQGPVGSGGVRIDAALASTWILPHSFGRVPIVQVYLSSGEQVTADIVASSTTITVVFAQPQQGFVIAS